MESVWVLLAFMLMIILAQVVANSSKWERVIFMCSIIHVHVGEVKGKTGKLLGYCKFWCPELCVPARYPFNISLILLLSLFSPGSCG